MYLAKRENLTPKGYLNNDLSTKKINCDVNKSSFQILIRGTFLKRFYDLFIFSFVFPRVIFTS